MARTGQVIASKSFPVVACNIVDIGAGGACVDMESVYSKSLPPRFELLYGGSRKKCRVVWRTGRRVGVCF